MIPLLALSLAAACVATVHDGDTVRLCSGERVRIANIDAPELAGSPRCTAASRARLVTSRNPAWCDYQRGEQARAILAQLIASGSPRIIRIGTDRYGRTLARITVNGRDAGATLIALGLARRWQ
jgi:micrococcal nuclease